LEPTFSPPRKPKEEPVIDEQKFDPPAEEDAGGDPVTNVDIVASRRRKPNKSVE
jgi:hypothetical protein